MKKVTRAKICGMQSAEDINAAVNYGADALGFITEIPTSKRSKDAVSIAELVSYVPVFIDSVIVTSPLNSQQAIHYVDICKPDVIQIHNDLPLLELEHLRDNISQKIIKVFSISLDKHNCYNMIMSQMQKLCDQNLIDAFLLDSSVQDKKGGTGIVHDWSISRKIVENIKKPVILAGGLHSGNVEEAIRIVEPYSVDVASGVETNGFKDEQKLNNFLKAVRNTYASI